MKKTILKLSGILASFALMITAMNVNVTCMLFAHQPKLPKGSDKLRKF